MKLCFILVCLFSFGLSATTRAQQERVSLELQEVSLREVLEQIREQTKLQFMMSRHQGERLGRFSVNVKNEPVEKVLDEIFSHTDLTYTFMEDIIVVKERLLQQQPDKMVITGFVKDAKKQTMPGVTVMIRGTSLGTVTGMDGRYTFTIPKTEHLTLIFSFVGMKTVEIPYKGEKELNVVMEEEVAEMDEVVITGIYSRKKESFTGSSTTYSAKELKTIGNTNVLQSLKTIDPSFAILENNQFGSDPNRLPDINIRGKTSVVGLTQEYSTDPNQPLFILDGFESTLETISDLSMDRVESITILKDAAATAIYGSKAANGVVVVETKSPNAGKLRVNYSGNLNFSFADLSDYNLMNASEKLEFEKLSGYYGKLDNNGNIVGESDETRYYRRLAEIRRGVNTYWLSEPIRFATTHRHTLFIEGGDDRIRYGLGMSYGKTQGVMKDSDRDVLNGNFRLVYRYKSLSFTNYMNVDYSKSSREKVAFSEFSQANPYFRKLNDLGEPNMILESYAEVNEDPDADEMIRVVNAYNPLYDMTLNNFSDSRNFSFRNNLDAEWRILKELRIRGRISVSKSVSHSETFKSPESTEFYETRDTDKGSYTESNADALSYDANATITYGKLLGEKHMINAVAGFRAHSNQNKNSSYSVLGYVDDRFASPSFSQGYPDGGKPAYSSTKKRSASYYVNAGYSYHNRYLLDANFRADGSSVFGRTQRFTTTWAFGVGWNMHNEKFLKDRVSWLDYLKLRFSVGNPGNQNFDAYIAMNIYSYSTAYPNPFALSAIIRSWGNTDLEWQKTLDKNMGLDVEILNRRLRLNLDFFMKDTDPLLVYIGLPTSTGTTSAPMNIGKQSSRGITVTLNLTLLKKENVNWSVNMNGRHITYEYQKIGNSLEQFNKENRSSSLTRYYDGGSPTDLWAVKSVGIDPATGKEIFIKKDGTQTFVHDYSDEVVVGNSDPTLEGVVGTSFYYKGFSASVNFRYRLGGQIFLNTLYDKVENISESDLKYNQDKRALHDRWQKVGDVSQFKGISLTSSTPMSSRFVANENTLSGESISIGYETQAKWLKNIGISSMTIQGYMNDIFRLSTVKNERGIDYPFARSVSLSLSVRF